MDKFLFIVNKKRFNTVIIVVSFPSRLYLDTYQQLSATNFSIYNSVVQMKESTITITFQGPYISLLQYTIGECEEGIPCLNLSKSGRLLIFAEFLANVFM